ncbi:hypothetical protein BREVUG8_110313 [Brevundimonas sp. G8]|nr:hypothetical protein BREVUG8_110313 [Brevundimonas sp. G8]
MRRQFTVEQAEEAAFLADASLVQLAGPVDLARVAVDGDQLTRLGHHVDGVADRQGRIHARHRQLPLGLARTQVQRRQHAGVADAIDHAAADDRTARHVANLGQGAGAAGARQGFFPHGLTVQGAQRDQLAGCEGRDDGVAADGRAGGAHDARRLGDAAIGPVLGAGRGVEGEQLAVHIDHEDAVARHGRGAMDRGVHLLGPDHRAGVGVQRRHRTIARGDEHLTAAHGDTAAEAAVAITVSVLDVGLPQDFAGVGRHGRNGRFAVQHENLAVGGHNGRHDVADVGRTLADVTLPGDLEVRRGDDVLDQVLGRAARLGPGRDRLGTGQEEVAARQGGRRRQALFELQHRNPLPGRGCRANLFLAAQAERQVAAHGAAGRDRHGDAADQRDFQNSVHLGRPVRGRHYWAAGAAAGAAAAGAEGVIAFAAPGAGGVALAAASMMGLIAAAVPASMDSTAIWAR